MGTSLESTFCAEGVSRFTTKNARSNITGTVIHPVIKTHPYKTSNSRYINNIETREMDENCL